jgi:hypothetical protein
MFAPTHICTGGIGNGSRGAFYNNHGIDAGRDHYSGAGWRVHAGPIFRRPGASVLQTQQGSRTAGQFMIAPGWPSGSIRTRFGPDPVWCRLPAVRAPGAAHENPYSHDDPDALRACRDRKCASSIRCGRAIARMAWTWPPTAFTTSRPKNGAPSIRRPAIPPPWAAAVPVARWGPTSA